MDVRISLIFLMAVMFSVRCYLLHITNRINLLYKSVEYYLTMDNVTYFSSNEKYPWKKNKGPKNGTFTNEALRELVMNLRLLKPFILYVVNFINYFVYQKSFSTDIMFGPVDVIWSVLSWMLLGHSWSIVFSSD